MKTRYIIALAAGALALCGCQRESLAPELGAKYDGKVKFAPGVAGIGSANGGVRSGLSDGSAVIGSGSLTLRSADGRFTIPMTLSVTGTQAAGATSGARTRGELINEKGGITADEFATAISDTFMVAAWSDDDATPEQIIPDATAKAFPVGYVSASKEYQKVMYRDSLGASGNGKYWMTVQPQTAGTGPSVADDEYIWKSSENKKTFYAYANVPTGATVALLAEGAGQTMTCTGVPTQDILMGYYYGDGTPVSSEKRSGTASIRFYHPLTAVKFLAGDLADGAEITGISIENVYGGFTEFKVTQEGTVFTWTKSDDTSLGASAAYVRIVGL